MAQDRSGCNPTRFKSGFATPHASGQLLQLHTFQVRTCNSTRLRPPCSSTCLMSAFATPHVSGQPLQLNSFQINHCNSTCFRSALATPHIWDQPLQLHTFQVCPCSCDSMFSPFSIWLLSRKHKVKSFQAFCGHTKALEAFSQWLFGRVDYSFGVIWHAFTNLYLKRASRSSLKQVLKKCFWQGLEASLQEINIEIFNFCSWSNEIWAFSSRRLFGRVYLRCFSESGNHWNTTVIITFFEGLGVSKGCLFYMNFIGF